MHQLLFRGKIPSYLRCAKLFKQVSPRRRNLKFMMADIKTKKKPRKNREVTQYDEDKIQKALAEIRAGNPKKTIAKKYNIPRSTLQFRLSSKFTKTIHGPNTYLTSDEENMLVSWILESQEKGFPKRKLDLQLSVKQFLDAVERTNPFKDNMPGDHWYKSFLNRHPILTHRTPEAVTAASSNVSENDIKKWFADIERYLKSKDYFSILKDPSRVFNGDETCFLFCPKLGKVIAPKATKNVYEIDKGQAKENLTVMFSFSASGCKIPPLIIFPNKRISKAVSSSVPDNWGIACTENGWMKAEVFIDYIKKIFYKHLVQENVKFPVILFVDGHQTHLTYELSKVCTDLQIILIALYPNATRILQPADVACFKPLKSLWKSGVLQWRRENPYCQLGKQHFAPILQKCILQLSDHAIINGFRACGLYPWCTSSIDFSKCLGKNRFNDDLEVPCSSRNSSEDAKTLSFKKFCDILGERSLQELEIGEINKNQHNCHYFRVLKDIYSELKPDTSEKNPTDIEIVEILLEDNGNASFTEDDILNMPLVFGIDTLDQEDVDRNEAFNKKDSSSDVNTTHPTDSRDNASIPLNYETGPEKKIKNNNLQNIILNKNEKKNSAPEEMIHNRNRDENIEIFDEETKQECDKENRDKTITGKKIKQIKILSNIVLNEKEKNSSSEEMKLGQNADEEIKIFDKETRQECDKGNTDKAIIEKQKKQKNIISNIFLNKNVKKNSSPEEKKLKQNRDEDIKIFDEEMRQDGGEEIKDRTEKKTEEKIIKVDEYIKERNAAEICNKEADTFQPVRKNLNEFLQRPKTPERTGKKSLTKVSYVLVSSDYKKYLEEKENDKIQKEKKKQVNKVKRENRAKEMLFKKTTANKKRNNPNNDNVRTTDTNKKRKEALADNNINTDNVNQDHKNPIHVRKLFIEELKGDAEDEPKNNQIVKQGLCFICTYNITLTNIGIKCSKCVRAYHYKCLKTHNIYNENLVCKSCFQKSR